MIHAQLDREGLPRDLMAVAFIESGLDPLAVSPVGATGLWQFIEETGRLYGLSRTEELDQRRAPLLATQAAARYLRELYDQFHDWPLALASYNAGPGRVRQLLDETVSRDFWSLAERSLALPEETQSYVPKIFAVMTLLRNPRAYGFEPLEDRPLPILRTRAVTPATPLELLARALALPVRELREINPELLVDHVPTTQGDNVVRIPDSRVTLSELALGDEDADVDLELLRELARVTVPEFSFEGARCFPRHCRGNRDASGWKQVRDALDAASQRLYRVKPGDSLEKVAALFGISAKRLMSENGVRHPHALRVGQTLRVPATETM
jgi:membrane-bound lytic murein transglycosylase D